MEAPGMVDFAAVRENAALDGIDLQEIAIKYVGLTDDEINALAEQGLLARRMPTPGTVLGKFSKAGEALFPHKAEAVFHLAG